ncbi:MAG: hypothetical protein RIT28_1759 [Pseudomonadota bacterium]|jgi:hypothetical protein
MRAFLALSVLALTFTGCWEKKVKNLSDAEFDHYYVLKPFMSEESRKTYLKLKTEEERNQYLKDQGLWDRFYKYSEAERAEIVSGAVAIGWTKDKVLMAWGPPHDKQKLVGREAQRSERLVYRFEEQPDGTVLVWAPNSKTEYQAVRLYQVNVILDDDKVTEIIEKPRWD